MAKRERGRIGIEAGGRRDHVETAMASLVGLLAGVDEVLLRMRQAMRRSGLVGDVLQPACERLEQVREELRLVQREIGAAWSEGQSRRWRQDE